MPVYIHLPRYPVCKRAPAAQKPNHAAPPCLVLQPLAKCHQPGLCRLFGTADGVAGKWRRAFVVGKEADETPGADVVVNEDAARQRDAFALVAAAGGNVFLYQPVDAEAVLPSASALAVLIISPPRTLVPLLWMR